MHLDLLPYAKTCRVRTTETAKEIWCPVRRRWVIAQPEEFVRQGLIQYLQDLGYPLPLMQVERKVGSTADRLDLLILDREGRPFVLAEAKAPGYKLQPAIDQLARYNRHWHAPFALAVNGEQALCYRVNWKTEQISALGGLPAYPVDKKSTNSSSSGA
jgi:hypothetical protein